MNHQHDYQCSVLGCIEPNISRLPFCHLHLYEHNTCEVFGCLAKLPLTSRRCHGHHPQAPTKKEVASDRQKRVELDHAAE